MDKDELLRRYLDGELSPEEEQEALHVIADNPELRSMLRFEQKLSNNFAYDVRTTDEVTVPEGFSDKVMHRIEEQSKNVSEEESLTEKIREWYRQLWTPRQIQWRPVYAFAMSILVLFALSYPVFMAETGSINNGSNQQAMGGDPGSSIQAISSFSDEVMLRFVYFDDEANSVSVAGDFSNWEPIKLSKQTVDGEQVWTGLVSMKRGEHSYMFIKDGEEWVTDPLAPVQRDDGFGNKNAVVYL